MTDLVAWLRQQLDTDEQKALLAKAEIEAASKTWQGFADDIWKRALIDADGIADHLEAYDPDRVLRQVQAHRAILDEYEHQLAKKAENSAKFVAMTKSASLDQQEFTNVKTHGWELKGRVDALKFAARTLLAIYSDRDGYKEEWSA